MIGQMLSRLIALVVPSLCVACGADASRAAPLCHECRARMGALPFPYEGPAGAMVRALKFGGRVAIADSMAAQIVAHAPPDLLHGAVVAVPVHPTHRRRRGLDHTAALGRAVARRAGIVFADCLIRTGDPQPQVGRGRSARMRGPAGSIALGPDAEAPPEVVLIDDVITTGATLAACTTALRVAGCQHITPIAYARTTAR
jgi:predicted amidophosphoribosyltransferase